MPSGSPTSQDLLVAVRILLVDDSPHFRGLAAQLLDAHGFELFGEAADGERALAAVAAECPDGVLLDIDLPGLDGFAVAELLAAACSGAKIVLTSAGVRHVPTRVLESCAAVAFVPKDDLMVADLDSLFRR